MFASRNRSSSVCSCRYARTTRTPASASCATALTSDSCAWICSNRRWIALPKYFTETDTNGNGMSEYSVSLGSMANIIASATTNVRMVFAEYITDGPIIMRTAFRSLVARDIRSPVRWVWKYGAGSFSRWAKKSFRMLYSMSRDAPMRILRIRNRKTPPTRPIASSAVPYSKSFTRVTPCVRSSIAN